MVPDPLGAFNPSSFSISGVTDRQKMTSWHPHTQPNWLLVFSGCAARE